MTLTLKSYKYPQEKKALEFRDDTKACLKYQMIIPVKIRSTQYFIQTDIADEKNSFIVE